MGIEWSSGYNDFPLHEAVKKCDATVVQTLLQKGSLTNCKDALAGWTPLQYAVKKDNFEIAKLLLDHSALVEKTGGEFGQTSLHISIEANASIGLVDLLIQNNSAINA